MMDWWFVIVEEILFHYNYGAEYRRVENHKIPTKAFLSLKSSFGDL